MHDELNSIGGGDSDLEKSPRTAGTDEHHEVVERERSDRVAVGVVDVIVADPVFARTGENDGLHLPKLP